MATVEMDLSELDEMRNKIISLKTDLTSEKESALIEITRLNTNISRYEKRIPTILKKTVKLVRNIDIDADTVLQGLGNMYQYESYGRNHMNLERHITDIIRRAVDDAKLNNHFRIASYNSKPASDEEIIDSSTTYLNFESIRAELKEEVDASVLQENRTLKDKVNTNTHDVNRMQKKHREELSDIANENMREISELRSKNRDTIKDINKTYDKKIEKEKDLYKSLEEAYETLKSNKVEKKKDDVILELTERLKVIENKGFWQRVFNN